MTTTETKLPAVLELKCFCPSCGSSNIREIDSVLAGYDVKGLTVTAGGLVEPEYGSTETEVFWDCAEVANPAQPYDCGDCGAEFGTAELLAADGREEGDDVDEAAAAVRQEAVRRFVSRQEAATEKAPPAEPEAIGVRTWQIAFVRELAGTVLAELEKDVREGKVPEGWNGIQLRALLARRFDQAKMGREGDRRFWRDFMNEVQVRGL